MLPAGLGNITKKIQTKMRQAYVITKDHLIDYSFGLIYEPMVAQNIVKNLESPDYYWSYRKAKYWDITRFKQI